MAGPRSCRPVVHGQSDVWLEGIKPKRGRGSSDAGICEHRVHGRWIVAIAKPPQILNRCRIVGPGRNARIRPVVTRVGGCLHRSHRGGRAIWVLACSPSHVVETPLVLDDRSGKMKRRVTEERTEGSDQEKTAGTHRNAGRTNSAECTYGVISKTTPCPPAPAADVVP